MAAVLEFPPRVSPGCNVPEAECLGFCMAEEKPLLKFAVRVDADGDRHFYTGLFPSSWGAVEDALERFGEDVTRIHVRKVTA